MKKIICLFIGIIAVSQSFGQTHTNEIGFQTDNDSYLGQGSDRYYTNGFYDYFRHALKIKGDTTKLKNKVLGFELGQKLYNPQSGKIPDRTYVDRPVAGYFYAGVNLNYLYADESNIKIGAQLGLVGPGSAGELTQTAIHKWFSYKINIWQYQIHDGLELNLTGEYNKLLARTKGIDLSFTGNAALGNGFTGAGAGFMLRLGNFNQLYNSVSTQSTVSRLNANTLFHKHEFFAYYKPVLNYVAYDVTIQGSLFNKTYYPDQITLTKQPFVFANQVGAAYTSNRWVFDLSVIFHTREVKEMVASEQWGTATALYRFK